MLLKLKLKIRWQNQNMKCLKWRWPRMKEDLKIIEVEYLSNHWSDLAQILNLCLGTTTKFERLQMKITSNWIRNIKCRISKQQLLGSFSLKLKHRGPNQNFKLCQPPNLLKVISQQLQILSRSNFKLKLRELNQNLKTLQMKTTSYRRQSQNIKSGKSQQPLIWFC